MGHVMESRERIEEAAALWVAKRHGEEWGAADDAALAKWLNAAPGNRVAYLRLSQGWQKAGRLSAFGAGVPEGVVPTPEQMQASPYFDRERRASIDSTSAIPEQGPLRARQGWRALAAGFVIAAVLGVLGLYLSSQGPEYRTEIGGLESVPMPDGSKVTLNTNSEIRLAVTAKERRVELRQGEAYFEVAKDPSRPFVVRAGDQRVVAVGTKFSVRRESEGLRVVVTEGKVRIESVGGGAGAALAEVPAGRIAASLEHGVLIQEKPRTEVEEFLSWRSGYLIFRGTSLADAVAEFNRYNMQQLVIEDPYIAGLRIDGNFRATNVDVFLRLLASGFPVAVDRRDDRIVLKAISK